jgi:hypothetical protein
MTFGTGLSPTRSKDKGYDYLEIEEAVTKRQLIPHVSKKDTNNGYCLSSD